MSMVGMLTKRPSLSFYYQMKLVAVRSLPYHCGHACGRQDHPFSTHLQRCMVNRHSGIKAWVCVSDEFDVLRVVKTILESLTSQNM